MEVFRKGITVVFEAVVVVGAVACDCGWCITEGLGCFGTSLRHAQTTGSGRVYGKLRKAPAKLLGLIQLGGGRPGLEDVACVIGTLERHVLLKKLFELMDQLNQC